MSGRHRLQKATVTRLRLPLNLSVHVKTRGPGAAATKTSHDRTRRSVAAVGHQRRNPYALLGSGSTATTSTSGA